MSGEDSEHDVGVGANEHDFDDLEIEGRLRNQSSPLWPQLWAAVDALLPADQIAVWRGGQVEDHLAAGTPVYGVPYPVYDETVERIIQLLYDLKVVTTFDWPTWFRLQRYPGGQGLDAAPAAEAVRLLTSYVRGERFSDGAIEQGFQDGSIGAALSRLRRWWRESPEEVEKK